MRPQRAAGRPGRYPEPFLPGGAADSKSDEAHQALGWNQPAAGPGKVAYMQLAQGKVKADEPSNNHLVEGYSDSNFANEGRA